MPSNAYGFDENKLKVAIDDAIRDAIDGIDLSDQINSYINRIYPVGTIYTSAYRKNPYEIFGFGEWTEFASGRTLVGVDTTNSLFDSPLREGGHTELANHSHTFEASFSLRSGKSGIAGGKKGKNTVYTSKGDSSDKFYPWEHDNSYSQQNLDLIKISGNTGTAGTGTGKNMPPYVTVYFYRRIS